MNAPKRDRFRVVVKPLTALHIGSGEELTPLEYLIARRDQKNEQRYLYRFRSEEVIAAMNETTRQTFLEATRKSDALSDVRRQIARLVLERHEQFVHYRSPVTPEVHRLYTEHKDDPKNQLVVIAQSRGASEVEGRLALLPGSSLKGAIRTAILAGLFEELPEQQREKILATARERRKDVTEGAVLGYRDARSDPFRMLQIADAPFRGDKTEMVAQMNLYRPGKEENSPQMIGEFVRGALLDGDATASISITIDGAPYVVQKEVDRGRQTWQPLRHRLSREMIFRHCNRFYQKLMEDECQRFYLASDSSLLQDTGECLMKEASAADGKRSCLLRVGRFSHIEAMTVEGFATSGKRRTGGKSRTLLQYGNARYPVGWAIMALEE